LWGQTSEHAISVCDGAAQRTGVDEFALSLERATSSEDTKNPGALASSACASDLFTKEAFRRQIPEEDG